MGWSGWFNIANDLTHGLDTTAVMGLQKELCDMMQQLVWNSQYLFQMLSAYLEYISWENVFQMFSTYLDYILWELLLWGD